MLYQNLLNYLLYIKSICNDKSHEKLINIKLLSFLFQITQERGGHEATKNRCNKIGDHVTSEINSVTGGPGHVH